MTNEDRPVSTRNLIDPDAGALRRFIGILDSMPKEDRVFGEGAASRTTTRVSLNVRDIEVLEAVEPYHFPIYTININLSNRKKSRWGVLGASFNDVVDASLSPAQLTPSDAAYVKPENRMDIGDAVGKKIGFVMADGIDGRPESPSLFDGRDQTDKPTLTWMIYLVDGVGSTKGDAALDDAISLLDGKTLAEFNTAALANTRIRADVPLREAISKPLASEDSFANTMILSGTFSKDENGVYHKVG